MSDKTRIDPRIELEFQGRYREGSGSTDATMTSAIARGVQEIDRLRATLCDIYRRACSGIQECPVSPASSVLVEIAQISDAGRWPQ